MLYMYYKYTIFVANNNIMDIIKNINLKLAPIGRPTKYHYPELKKLKVGDGFIVGDYTEALRNEINSAITALVRTPTIKRSEAKKKFSVLKAANGKLFVKRIK